MVQLIYLLFPYTIIVHLLVQLLNQLFKWLTSLHVIPLEQLSFLLFSWHNYMSCYFSGRTILIIRSHFSELFCHMKLNISTNCNIRCVFLFILQMTWIRLWDQEWDCETKTGTVRPIFGLWDQYLDCVTRTGTVRPTLGLWDQDLDCETKTGIVTPRLGL